MFTKFRSIASKPLIVKVLVLVTICAVITAFAAFQSGQFPPVAEAATQGGNGTGGYSWIIKLYNVQKAEMAEQAAAIKAAEQAGKGAAEQEAVNLPESETAQQAAQRVEQKAAEQAAAAQASAAQAARQAAVQTTAAAPAPAQSTASAQAAAVSSGSQIPYLEQKPEGTAGRLYIPDLGINVGMYSTSIMGSEAANAQAITDAQDSAATFSFDGHTVIADHNNQGFSGIRKAVAGSTHLYVQQNGQIKDYVCLANIQGHNTSRDIVDSNYNSASLLYPGSYMLYTCNENWHNITITFWTEA